MKPDSIIESDGVARTPDARQPACGNERSAPAGNRPGSRLRGIPAPIQILAFTAVLCAGYWALLAICGGRAELAESNLQSNLLRIINYYSSPPPDAAIVGTSLTGRLLPSFFGEKELEVANLGLDGGTTLHALELFAAQKTLPKLLLVETNLLFRDKNDNDRLLAEALEGGTTRLSRWFPLVRPQYRVSAILYSRLKMARDRAEAPEALPAEDQAPQKLAGPLLPVEPPAASRVEAIAPAPAEEEAYRAVAARLREIQERGVKVVLVRIPAGNKNGEGELWRKPAGTDLALRLAYELNMGYCDLGPMIASHGKNVVFTDGLHLSTASARTVVNELVGAKLGVF